MTDFLRRIFAFLTGHRTGLAEPEVYVDPVRIRDDGKKEEPAYMTKAREECLAFLGPRHVLHPQYVCKATTYESFLRQPPSVLNTWRGVHVDPKKRVDPAQKQLQLKRVR